MKNIVKNVIIGLLIVSTIVPLYAVSGGMRMQFITKHAKVSISEKLASDLLAARKKDNVKKMHSYLHSITLLPRQDRINSLVITLVGAIEHGYSDLTEELLIELRAMECMHIKISSRSREYNGNSVLIGALIDATKRGHASIVCKILAMGDSSLAGASYHDTVTKEHHPVLSYVYDLACKFNHAEVIRVMTEGKEPYWWLKG